MSDVDDAPLDFEEEETVVNVMEGYCEDEETISDSLPKDELDEHSDSNVETERSRRTHKKFVLASHVNFIEGPVPCYYCTICKRYFSYKSTARNHEFCGTDKKPFKCKLCDKRFLKKGDRDNHHRIHTGECPYTCATCNKSFQLKHKLSRHIRTHTREKGDYVCSSCPQRFFNEQSRKKHEVTRHNFAKTFQCTDCEKRFASCEEKDEHECCKSPKEKNFICEICGKTFSKSYNLKMHRRIHLKERPFQCTKCKRCFRMKQHLLRHSMKHESDNEFECTNCLQSFGRKDNLLRHLKLYHQENETVKTDLPTKSNEPGIVSKKEASASSVTEEPKNKYGKNVKSNPKKVTPSRELLNLKTSLNKANEVPKRRTRGRASQSLKPNPIEGTSSHLSKDTGQVKTNYVKSVGVGEPSGSVKGSLNDEERYKTTPTVVVLTNLPNIRFAKSSYHLPTEIGDSSTTESTASANLRNEENQTTVIHRKPAKSLNVLPSPNIITTGADSDIDLNSIRSRQFKLANSSLTKTPALTKRSISDNSILYRPSTSESNFYLSASSEMDPGRSGVTSVSSIPRSLSTARKLGKSSSSITPKMMSRSSNTPNWMRPATPPNLSSLDNLPSIEQLSISSKQSSTLSTPSGCDISGSIPSSSKSCRVSGVDSLESPTKFRRPSPSSLKSNVKGSPKKSTKSKKASLSKESRILKNRSISDTAIIEKTPGAGTKTVPLRSSQRLVSRTAYSYDNPQSSKDLFNSSKRSISDSTIIYRAPGDCSSNLSNPSSLDAEPLAVPLHSSKPLESIRSQPNLKSFGKKSSPMTTSTVNLLSSKVSFNLSQRSTSDSSILSQPTTTCACGSIMDSPLTKSSGPIASTSESSFLHSLPSTSAGYSVENLSTNEPISMKKRSISYNCIPHEIPSTSTNTVSLNTSLEIDVVPSAKPMNLLESSTPENSTLYRLPSTYAIHIVKSPQTYDPSMASPISDTFNLIRSVTNPQSSERSLNFTKRSTSDSSILYRPNFSISDPLAITPAHSAEPLDLSKRSTSDCSIVPVANTGNFVFNNPWEINPGSSTEVMNLSTSSTVENSFPHSFPPTRAIYILNASNVPDLVPFSQKRQPQPIELPYSSTSTSTMLERSTNTHNWKSSSLVTSNLTSPSKTLHSSIEQLSISETTTNSERLTESHSSIDAGSSFLKRFCTNCTNTIFKTPSAKDLVPSAEPLNEAKRSTSDSFIFKKPSTVKDKSSKSFSIMSPKGSWRLRFSELDQALTKSYPEEKIEESTTSTSISHCNNQFVRTQRLHACISSVNERSTNATLVGEGTSTHVIREGVLRLNRR